MVLLNESSQAGKEKEGNTFLPAVHLGQSFSSSPEDERGEAMEDWKGGSSDCSYISFLG